MESRQKRPNILIFMTDQEQAQVTLPEHPCRTPNLDRFGREGIRFTSAYPPMAHCCPSRASFMTGLYPSQHGIHNNVLNEQALGRSLKDGVATFSEQLKDAGYDLYYSGKWHVSATEMPRDRGWKELSVTGGIGDHHGKTREKWAEMPYEADLKPRGNGELLRPGWGTYRLYGSKPGADYRDGGDYDVVRQGVGKIRDLKDSRDPWCLYLGICGPHDPFIIPEKYAALYNPDDIPLPPNYYDELSDKPAVYRRMRKFWNQLTEREVRESIAHYWGYCTMIDDLFGEVLLALEDSGQKEDTLVVFLSDHGEHCGAHGIYLKGISTFDEGYHIPCLMRWPAGIADPGRIIDDFVSIMDLAPTLIEAAGAAPLGRCSGASLMPFLAGRKPDHWRDSIFTQCNGVEVYYTNRMVRTRQYKFVYTPIDFDELYDLTADPWEMHNLAADPHMQAIKEQMLVKMWQHVFQSEDTLINEYAPIAMADLGPAVLNRSRE